MAVMLVLSFAIRIFGLEQYLGQGMTSMLIYAFIFGMAGSFISLAMSKSMAKRSTGAVVIENPSNETEQWLMDIVRKQADAANIGMPEVAIFDTPQVNAFATGMNKNKALVAVSSGLLNTMTREEAEAVMAHEISHVANGDMITLTLIQGVLNTFVIFFSRIIGNIVDKAIFKNQRGYGVGYFITSMAAQFLLGILASIIVSYFSRIREYRADEGGADLSSKQNMIGALRRLQAQHEPEQLPDQLAAFGISGATAGGFKRLFRSHPDLSERIDALERYESTVSR
ncbi:MAG: protease HtpX [Acidiferrobacterales bacterium]|nr:protease HtpX [Acidiferrobacterales bacterium]